MDTTTIQEGKDFLAHYGVLGMKWGQRKTEPEVVLNKKLKDGGQLVVTKDPPVAIAKLLSKISSKYQESSSKYHSFTLKDKDGNRVGEASFHQDSPDSLNLVWLGVKTKHRGKGYASAVMEGIINYSKDHGINKLTLEVPGNAPDALHIYEKMGFKKLDAVYDVENEEYDVWGGLTNMEYLIPKKSLSHAELNMEDVIDYIVDSLNNISDDSLSHAGVLGMKWGQRKSEKEQAEEDRLTAKRKGNILGGVVGFYGGLTAADILMGPKAVVPKKSGAAFIASLFSKKPSAAIPSPQSTSVAKMLFKNLKGSKYGRLVAGLGGVYLAASIGGKLMTDSYDNAQTQKKLIAQEQRYYLQQQRLEQLRLSQIN